MPGYEDLTPDQLMLIMYLVFSSVFIFVIGRLASDLIRHRTAKLIQFKVEREIIKNIQDELTKEKKPFVIKIKEWWAKRKEKKDECPVFR